MKHETKQFTERDVQVTDWLILKSASEKTAVAYRADLASFFAYLDRSGLPFDQATHIDITQWRLQLAAGGKTGKRVKAPSSVARKLAAVCSFYAFLNAQKITTVELSLVDRPKVVRGINKKDIPTIEEMKAILSYLGSQSDEGFFVRFLYRTGMRIGEVCAAKWRDLTDAADGESAELHVIGKGKKPGDVAIIGKLWGELRTRREGCDRNAAIFPTWTPDKASQYFKRLCKALEFGKNITPHSFRHAFASHALEAGATPAEVRDALRHADLSTTSLYLSADRKRSPAARLEVE